VVGEHSGARHCLIYLAEHGAEGPVLRPSAAYGPEPETGSPSLALQAFQERSVRRSPAGARGLRLALPIALGPARIGALVLRFEERGAVGVEEEAALRAVASQLAAVLHNASTLLEARESGAEAHTEVIRGEGASHGLALGKALHYEAGFEPAPREAEPPEPRARALERFQDALALTRRQVEELRRTC